jgi:hypothetical protein
MGWKPGFIMQIQIPDGWKSIAQAAAIAGYDESVVRRWARRIRADGDYTTEGLPPTGVQGERLVKGAELKRSFRGRIIIADGVVEAMRRSNAKGQELKAQGWLSATEIAAQHGISVGEVLKAARRSARHSNRRPG